MTGQRMTNLLPVIGAALAIGKVIGIGTGILKQTLKTASGGVGGSGASLPPIITRVTAPSASGILGPESVVTFDPRSVERRTAPRLLSIRPAPAAPPSLALASDDEDATSDPASAPAPDPEEGSEGGGQVERLEARDSSRN